jgi:hypothetical protein
MKTSLLRWIILGSAFLIGGLILGLIEILIVIAGVTGFILYVNYASIH